MTTHPVYELIQSQLKNLVDQSKVGLSETKRLTVDAAWKTLQFGIAQICISIEEVASHIQGAEKKKAALLAVAKFYDEVIVKVNIPFIPFFVKPVFDSSVRLLFIQLASGAIDATVVLLKTTTIFLKERKNV